MGARGGRAGRQSPEARVTTLHVTCHCAFLQTIECAILGVSPSVSYGLWVTVTVRALDAEGGPVHEDRGYLGELCTFCAILPWI
jgi:hypothetical protein